MRFPELTHHIQLTILRNMLGRPESRYSDLKPKTVEANLFMYHLKQLMKADLIEKSGKNYVLTRQGKLFADRATLESMRIRVQPKLITILCVRRSDGQWLALRRKHQPFNDYMGFPSGKIHYGEGLQTSANRELKEKAGLENVELSLRGNVMMRFFDGNEVVNHIVGYVFYGEVPAGTDVAKRTEHYDTFFGNEDELFREPCFKGHREILTYLSGGEQLFIKEDDFTSDI